MATAVKVCQIDCGTLDDQGQPPTGFDSNVIRCVDKDNFEKQVNCPKIPGDPDQETFTRLTICAAPTGAQFPVTCIGDVLPKTSQCYSGTISVADGCATASSISITSISIGSTNSPVIISTSESPNSVAGAISSTTSAIPGSSASSKSTGTKSGDVSKGAAAGIAIGTAILGAAIAGLIFLFLFQRYRKRNQQQSSYTQHLPPSAYNAEAAKAEKPQMNVVQTGVAMVDTYLPQPAEDDAITGELSRIRDKIKNHVQSYYHTSPVNGNLVDQSKLQEIAAATALPPAKFQELLLNPHSRMAAVRLYLAWIILSRCGTQRTGGTSFLPGEVGPFTAFLAGIDNGNAGKVALASKWKAISGELLQGRYGQQPTDNANLEQSIGQAIAAADSVLSPFVNSSIEATSDKRLRNLDSIMRRGAQFAFLLFSQPSSFTLDWTTPQGRLVVFPGLSQIVNEDGYACRPPRVFSEPEVVAGAGS